MKKIMGLSMILISLIGITGCSKKNDVSNTKTTISTTVESKKLDKNKKISASDVDWKEAQNLLKKNTQAENSTVFFENNTKITNGNDNVSVIINGYQYLKIEKFSKDLQIPFGGQTESGGVLLVSATYKNNTDKSIFAGPGFSMSVVGYDLSVERNKSLLEDDLVDKLVQNKKEIKSNEEITGYVALAIKPEAVEKIAESGTAEFEIPGLYDKADSFSSADALVEPKKETIALTDAGNSTKESNSQFYGDKATKDNMGIKTMVTEKEINETSTFENVNVTLEGYQVTTFEPNEDQASRFNEFETGIVLMTLKINLQNGGDTTLNVNQTSGALTIGDSVKMLSDNMLQVDDGEENLSKGNQETKYLVFALDKEAYEKLYKDQDYHLSVNLYDSTLKRITTVDDLSFDFSNNAS